MVALDRKFEFRRVQIPVGVTGHDCLIMLSVVMNNEFAGARKRHSVAEMKCVVAS